MHILLGNGGHARACRDVAGEQFPTLHYLSDEVDSDPLRVGAFGDVGHFADAQFHLAIGPSRMRSQIAAALHRAGTPWFSIISRHAVVRSSDIGQGVFFGHGAYVGPAVSVGSLVIVNTAAVVEHDCVIGDGAFIGPGAVLCGGVTIGAHAMIGAGVVIVPKMEIAPDARVPAGVTVR